MEVHDQAGKLQTMRGIRIRRNLTLRHGRRQRRHLQHGVRRIAATTGAAASATIATAPATTAA